MPPRETTRSGKENDYSNIGVSGRRTGLILPQGRLDANGIEEITGIFSSPRKPSPLRKSIHINDGAGIQDDYSVKTPTATRSTRKQPFARSASPRKSGINGTAKRGDVLRQKHGKENQILPLQSSGKSLASSPTPSSPTRSPATPSQLPVEVSATRSQTVGKRDFGDITADETPQKKVSSRKDNSSRQQPSTSVNRTMRSSITSSPVTPGPIDDFAMAAFDDANDFEPAQAGNLLDFEFEPLPPLPDDEEADQTFEPEKRSAVRHNEPTIANSRKKRKSDVIEHDIATNITSSPAAKRAKRISDENTEKTNQRQKGRNKQAKPAADDSESQKTTSKEKTPAVESGEPINTLSSRQQSELNQVIEKFKARPGQKKSLYILRRESRGKSITQTRSGRISVKPVAYWRNERCVYGGSPGGTSLEDGARFPLNSIKEVIRTEEVQVKAKRKDKKSTTQKNKGKGKEKSSSRDVTPQDADTSDEDELDDPEAVWETETGTMRGTVNIWDSEINDIVESGEEEIDIAHAADAIITKEVADSSFRYAKLLSSKFFGSGLVELQAGGSKKTKNSRKMHMSFFVATGRVSATVGPLGGPQTTFSIGKGGFWQVPRGNQYSIENKHDKTATIFFSQACEVMIPNYALE